MRGIRAQSLLVLIGVGFVLFGCGPQGSRVLRDFNIVSTQQEVELGRQFSIEVEKEYPLLKDQFVTEYVSQLGDMVVAVSDRHDLTYTFHVTQSDQVNAFALPGGFVYVNKGLIQEAANEAELVSVVAHEVAHVAARHSAEQLTKQLGLDLVASLLLGDRPDYWAQQAVNLFGTTGLLAFSRADEMEADTLAVRYMYSAGYDPWAMVTFLEKILAERDRRPSGLEEFFSTHPNTENRLGIVKDEIRALPDVPDLLLDTTRFHRIQSYLQRSS